MIIYAKIRRSIDYTDFILLNVHPAAVPALTAVPLLLSIVLTPAIIPCLGKSSSNLPTRMLS